MNNIEFTYSATDNAWKSSALTLSGHISMDIELENKGRVVIKKQNNASSGSSIVSISNLNTQFQYRLRGEAKGRIIQIYTSEKPKYIKYANI